MLGFCNSARPQWFGVRGFRPVPQAGRKPRTPNAEPLPNKDQN